MGLIRRHMKTDHDTNITASPPNHEGAESLPTQKGKEKSKEKTLTKCDQCDFLSKTYEQLMKHLAVAHSTESATCKFYLRGNCKKRKLQIFSSYKETISTYMQKLFR